MDQDGDVLDILVTRCRDRRAAKRFFRKMLKHQERPPVSAGVKIDHRAAVFSRVVAEQN